MDKNSNQEKKVKPKHNQERHHHKHKNWHHHRYHEHGAAAAVSSAATHRHSKAAKASSPDSTSKTKDSVALNIFYSYSSGNDDAPLPPGIISAQLEQMDAAMKQVASVGDEVAPVPAAQTAASYEDDKVRGDTVSTKKMLDTPLHHQTRPSGLYSIFNTR